MKVREAEIDAELRATFVATSRKVTVLYEPYLEASRMEIDVFVVSAMTAFILDWSDQRGRVATVEADRFCRWMVGMLAKASGRSITELVTLVQERFAEYRPLMAQSFSSAAGNGGAFLLLALDKNVLEQIPSEIPLRGTLLENAITHTAASVKKAYA